MTFHDDEHRINNMDEYGMAMKRRGGTKSKTIERMLNVFQSTFSASEMKALSRICASKTEKNLQVFG